MHPLSGLRRIKSGDGLRERAAADPRFGPPYAELLINRGEVGAALEVLRAAGEYADQELARTVASTGAEAELRARAAAGSPGCAHGLAILLYDLGERAEAVPLLLALADDGDDEAADRLLELAG